MSREHDATFTYRSYELRPGGGPPDPAKAAMIRAHFPSLRERARTLALDMSETPPRLGVDTRAAHELSKMVQALAAPRARALHLAVFRAHFVEGRDIADRGVLVELGAAVGLAPESVRRSVDGGDFREAVLSDEAEARALGIHGVPQLFLNGHALPPGLLPTEELLEAAREAIAAGAT